MMTESEIEAKLETFCRTKSQPDYMPSVLDWNRFEERIQWKVPDSFRSLMNVAPKFHFEGGLLRIASSDGIDGEETILSCLETEESIGAWDEKWLPFYDFGNGDYYSINKRSLDIWTIRHEDRQAVIFRSSFDEWITRLPDY